MNFIHLRKMVLLHQANEATLVIRQVANSPSLTNFEHLAARKMGFDFKKRKFCVSAKNTPFSNMYSQKNSIYIFLAI